MTAYYNENDPYAAQWLRNLIAENLIVPGVVDERSILDVEAYELREFTQCHFFAGIGVWSGALRSIGWPDDEPIWTGSCPCQPFSNAGKRKGIEDERHLWPIWHDLIAQCKPPRVVGEQVASKAGRVWLDTVSADLEALDFVFGASDLCAAGFGGAHLRQRIYFVGLGIPDHTRSFKRKQRSSPPRQWNSFITAGTASRLADDDDARLEGWNGMPECAGECADGPSGMASGLADSESSECESTGAARTGRARPANNRSNDERPILHSWEARSLDNADWLLCRNPTGEPSWRPVEPGTFPLAHGVSGRVGKLRAYGNALDFETAANFCAVVKELEGL